MPRHGTMSAKRMTKIETVCTFTPERPRRVTWVNMGERKAVMKNRRNIARPMLIGDEKKIRV